MADFPDVPSVPGVPPVLRAPGPALADVVDLMTEDGPDIPANSVATQWGIFDGGDPVVTADTVQSFEYRNESSISDYPVEDGAFETYDKVANPFDVRLRFVAGGSVAKRAAMLASIDAIAGDLNLYDVATPEKIYTSVNVTHRALRRTAVDGVGLLKIDVYVREIRVAPAAAFTSTKSPAAAAPKSGGNVQPQGPTQQEQNWLNTGQIN